MPTLKPNRSGLIYAVSAFGFWGMLPIYFKAVAVASPWEILAHRVLWSAVLTAGLLTWNKGWRHLASQLQARRAWLTLVATSLLVTSNWLVTIYAVTSGQVLSLSLGYYINPLFYVLLGMFFLGERLNRAQWFAVALAAAGTANLALALGQLPWISLALAITFGIYGLLRKTVTVGPVGGLFVETALMAPAALAGMLLLEGAGLAALGHLGRGLDLLLLAAGPVTAIPLLWFVAAARRLPLYVLGLLQYLAPSLHFVLGVAVYGETFGPFHLVTFACIWSGLVVFGWDSLRKAPAGP